MSLFSALDALTLDVNLAFFGDRATLFPMKSGAAGPNGPSVDADDPDRPPIADVVVLRSEWSERVQIGGNGMPVPTGGFRAPVAGQRHVAMMKAAGLPWSPRQGDHLVYADRPGERYRLAEPQPDGLGGLHFVLARV